MKCTLLIPVLLALNTKHRSAAGCSLGLPNQVSNTMWVEQCTAVEKQNNIVFALPIKLPNNTQDTQLIISLTFYMAT